ncbi:hypothetical protein NPX13_g4970 [Xylaria arbuscula]|uniref:Uncharacterized protein n=1 Tax=Xylaria arbuscula TaxID=114810 RepID=A0A9W8NFD0_9PEZI|nr:hypothetical protein NPX13_g4970 [Xylaria arbuscula]
MYVQADSTASITCFFYRCPSLSFYLAALITITVAKTVIDISTIPTTSAVGTVSAPTATCAIYMVCATPVRLPLPCFTKLGLISSPRSIVNLRATYNSSTITVTNEQLPIISSRGEELPPDPQHQDDLHAPASVLNQQLWCLGINYYEHIDFWGQDDYNNYQHINVEATWGLFRKSARDRILLDQVVDKPELLGHLLCAMIIQQKAIGDAVRRESIITMQTRLQRRTQRISECVNQQAYNLGHDTGHWWVGYCMDNTSQDWEDSLGEAIVTSLVPAVMAWRAQSMLRDGECPKCKEHRRESA